MSSIQECKWSKVGRNPALRLILPFTTKSHSYVYWYIPNLWVLNDSVNICWTNELNIPTIVLLNFEFLYRNLWVLFLICLLVCFVLWNTTIINDPLQIFLSICRSWAWNYTTATLSSMEKQMVEITVGIRASWEWIFLYYGIHLWALSWFQSLVSLHRQNLNCRGQ